MKDINLIQLSDCFLIEDLFKKVICFHRLACRDFTSKMTDEEKIEICHEISDISLLNPLHEMTRGNMKNKDMFVLKTIPNRKFSGVELMAWFFELMSQITNGMVDQILNERDTYYYDLLSGDINDVDSYN